METKPYRIQSPEDIAKDYAGNKQKIAQAMQLGVVDPTAGVLAGMFIDRMRSAQMQEVAPQRTVAQQIMGPPPAPMGPPAGLGATPEAAMMAPPMGAPMAPPMDAPMPQQAPPPGMAAGGMFEAPYMKDGGLSELPVPDGMFDENRDGAYAGGGIIAFADGGPIDPARLRAALRRQESSDDYGIMNAEGSGAMGAYQFMPNTARALAKRLGIEYRPDLMRGAKGRSKEGREYQERLMDAQMEDILAFAGDDVERAGAYHFAGPNEKGYGPKTRQYEKDILRRYGGSKDTGEIPERDTATAQGRALSAEDAIALGSRYTAPSEAELASEEKLRARFEEQGSEEYYKKQRKDDMWEALASFGANMASSKAPGLLQAIGEAAAATLPGMQADKKERKELKDRALEGLANLGIRDRKRRLEALEVGMDLFKTGLNEDRAERALEFQKRELTSRETQADLDRRLQKTIAGMRTSNPTQYESMMAIIMNGTPEQKTALEKYLELTKPQVGALAGDPAETGGAAGGNSGMTILGSRPVQ